MCLSTSRSSRGGYLKRASLLFWVHRRSGFPNAGLFAILLATVGVCRLWWRGGRLDSANSECTTAAVDASRVLRKALLQSVYISVNRFAFTLCLLSRARAWCAPLLNVALRRFTRSPRNRNRVLTWRTAYKGKLPAEKFLRVARGEVQASENTADFQPPPDPSSAKKSSIRAVSG